MGTASLISALLLGLVGLLAILFCLKLLASSLLGPGRGFVQRARIRYREKLAADADSFIGSGDLESAAALLRKAFYAEGVCRDMQLVDRLTSHHLSILERLLALAEKRSMHLENLAVLEDLILSRAHLMKALIEKKSLLRGERPMPAGEDAETPEWARQQFARVYAELRDRLITNQRSLESQLGTLFDSLLRSHEVEQVTYH